jgi:hypothetical protein
MSNLEEIKNMKKSIFFFAAVFILLLSGGLFAETISRKIIMINELSVTAGGLSDSTGETLHFYKDDLILNMTVFINKSGEVKCTKITTRNKGIFYLFDIKKIVFHSGDRFHIDQSLVNTKQRQNFELEVVQKTLEELTIP